ncbi:unnamed protein product [Closterium sp. NIES-53]
MRILAGRGITQRGSTSKPVKSLAPSKFASLRHMTVPHRWFSHFYIVGFALNLALLALALTAPSHLTTLLSTELPTGFSDITSSSKGSNGSSNYSSNNSSSESTVTSTPDITATSSVQALQLLLHRVPFQSLLFHLHLTRRLWESTALSSSPPSSQMHISAFFLGLCIPSLDQSSSSSSSNCQSKRLSRRLWESTALSVSPTSSHMARLSLSPRPLSTALSVSPTSSHILVSAYLLGLSLNPLSPSPSPPATTLPLWPLLRCLKRALAVILCPPLLNHAHPIPATKSLLLSPRPSPLAPNPSPLSPHPSRPAPLPPPLSPDPFPSPPATTLPSALLLPRWPSFSALQPAFITNITSSSSRPTHPSPFPHPLPPPPSFPPHPNTTRYYMASPLSFYLLDTMLCPPLLHHAPY